MTRVARKQAVANKVYLYDGIVRIDVVGDQTGASVRRMGEQVDALIQQLRAENRPVLILDNLRRLGDADYMAVRNVGILARCLDYDRAVMVGNGNPLVAETANLIFKAVGRQHTKFCLDMTEAERWLRA